MSIDTHTRRISIDVIRFGKCQSNKRGRSHWRMNCGLFHHYGSCDLEVYAKNSLIWPIKIRLNAKMSQPTCDGQKTERSLFSTLSPCITVHRNLHMSLFNTENYWLCAHAPSSSSTRGSCKGHEPFSALLRTCGGWITTASLQIWSSCCRNEETTIWSMTTTEDRSLTATDQPFRIYDVTLH